MIIKMSPFDRAVHGIGRVLLSLLFLGGGVQKIVDPAPSIALLADKGLPEGLVWAALAFNVIAGVLLIAGWWLRPLGLALAAYCLFTSWFHLVPNDPWQTTIMVKNWAIAGGCLIMATDSGRRSV